MTDHDAAARARAQRCDWVLLAIVCLLLSACTSSLWCNSPIRPGQFCADKVCNNISYTPWGMDCPEHRARYWIHCKQGQMIVASSLTVETFFRLTDEQAPEVALSKSPEEILAMVSGMVKYRSRGEIDDVMAHRMAVSHWSTWADHVCWDGVPRPDNLAIQLAVTYLNRAGMPARAIWVHPDGYDNFLKGVVLVDHRAWIASFNADGVKWTPTDVTTGRRGYMTADKDGQYSCQ